MPDLAFDLLLQLDLSMGNPLDPNPTLQTIGNLQRNLGAAAAFAASAVLGDSNNFQLDVVPEPSSLILAAIGILGLVDNKRRRRRKHLRSA
jgi:hypothetical protein